MVELSPSKMPSSFEKFLFSVTRLFALFFSVLCLLAIVTAVVTLYFRTRPPDAGVTYAELIQTNVLSRGSDLTQVALPPNVTKYIGADNRKVFLGWVDDLTPEQQRDFVANMSDVIASAEKNQADVIDVINKYKTLKLRKLKTSSLDDYGSQAFNGALIGSVLVLLLLLAILSLVLVLLAIERNTRALHVSNMPIDRGIAKGSAN